jgi:hypothetical protein
MGGRIEGRTDRGRGEKGEGEGGACKLAFCRRKKEEKREKDEKWGGRREERGGRREEGDTTKQWNKSLACKLVFWQEEQAVPCQGLGGIRKQAPRRKEKRRKEK